MNCKLNFFIIYRKDVKLYTMALLSNEKKQELLALKQDDLKVSTISKLFGKTTTRSAGKFVINPPKFNVRDKLHLNAGEYINIKEVDTTVGSFLFNKLMVEGIIEEIIPNGYYNEVINKGGFNKLIDIISQGLLMKKIPIDPNLIKWIKHYEFYSLKLSTVFSPSYTESLLKGNSVVKKEKEKLLKTKEIKSPTDMTDLEDQLVASSRKILEGDPGMTLFNSGARGSFENDYKNMNLMVGPVAIPGSDGEFDFMTSNYIEGIQKKDLVAAGNSIINSAFPKAV